MAKREFVMLAHVYEDGKITLGGWYASEKLDGQRMIWDGGITRGMDLHDVPFANTEKNARYIDQNIYATGLWSRNGKAIQAPGWFLDKLPPIPLDGEAYCGRGKFQEVSSIIRTIVPGPEWKNVKFMIFDALNYDIIFRNGSIETEIFKKKFEGIDKWANELAIKKGIIQLPMNMFEANYHKLKSMSINHEVADIVEQVALPYNSDAAQKQLEMLLTGVVNGGGEGLILRRGMSYWAGERSWNLLKVKQSLDSEAKVVGYTWGKKTTKGSKLLGKMGSLLLEWHGRKFELSGFTEHEREMTFIASGNDASMIGEVFAGKPVSSDIHNPKFPIGSMVTFKYRELTNDGIPKEGRYWRKFES